MKRVEQEWEQIKAIRMVAVERSALTASAQDTLRQAQQQGPYAGGAAQAAAGTPTLQVPTKQAAGTCKSPLVQGTDGQAAAAVASVASAVLGQEVAVQSSVPAAPGEHSNKENQEPASPAKQTPAGSGGVEAVPVAAAAEAQCEPSTDVSMEGATDAQQQAHSVDAASPVPTSILKQNIRVKQAPALKSVHFAASLELGPKASYN